LSNSDSGFRVLFMEAFERKHGISADRVGGEGDATGAEAEEAKDKALLKRALTYLVAATSTLEGKMWDRPRTVILFWRRPGHEAVLEAMRELSIDVADYLPDLVCNYNYHGGKMIQCLAMRGPGGVVRSVIFAARSRPGPVSCT
jgi:hypothetical protein